MLITQMQTVHRRALVVEGNGTAADTTSDTAVAGEHREMSTSRSVVSRSVVSRSRGTAYNPAAGEIAMTTLRKTELSRASPNGVDNDKDDTSTGLGVETLSPHTMRELVAKFDQSACNSVEGSRSANSACNSVEGSRSVKYGQSVSNTVAEGSRSAHTVASSSRDNVAGKHDGLEADSTPIEGAVESEGADRSKVEGGEPGVSLD